MEFIKNIFKKIKEFFTIHERVRLLKLQFGILDEKFITMRRRLEVLEFKNEAKGENYILSKVHSARGGRYLELWNVCYLRKNTDGTELVASVRTDEQVHYRLWDKGVEAPVINGDYIEFYRDGDLISVYVAIENEDALAKVDIDLYKKAYPEKFEKTAVLVCNRDTDNGAIIDIGCSTRSFTDIAVECTQAVKDLTDELKKSSKSEETEEANGD